MLVFLLALAAHAIEPSEVRLREWVAAFASQDEATYAAWVHENAPAIERFVHDDYVFSVHLGGLALERVTSATPTRAEADLTDPWSDTTTHLVVEVEPAPPHRVLAADLAPPRPREVPPFASERALAEALDARLRAQAADDRFSGVVLVRRGRRTVYAGAYGDLADLPRGCAPEEVPLPSASLGKMLTAAAILRLRDAGAFDLDAPVGRYVPEVADRPLGPVTLRQLLSHTGGAGDIFVDEVRAAGFRGLGDLVALLRDRPPAYPPGTRFEYANYGFALLGRALEEATGQPWDAWLGEHVVRPARSGRCPTEVPLRTRGPDAKAWVTRPPGLEEVPTPAGGLPLTAHQLAGFAGDLLDGRLVAPESVAELTTGTVEIPGGRYALGFKDQVRAGLRYVGHGGSAPGTNHAVDVYPRSGYVVVVLTNRDPPYGNRVADFVGNRLGILAAADAAGGDAPAP